MNSELEALRQDQRLYRELFEESLGLMCVHDLDGVLLVVNPAAAQSLGFRPQDGSRREHEALSGPSGAASF